MHPVPCRPGLRRLTLEAFLVAAIATGVLVLVLGLWKVDLRVPFAYGGDANFYGALTKGMQEHGWYLRNPNLGWPVGQQLFDLPLGADNLQFALLKVMGWLTGDWVLGVNLYFLLGFPLVAAVTHLVARTLRLPWTLSAGVAVLYTFLAYHFVRGTTHLLLSAYFAVPLGALLVLWALTGEEAQRDADPDRRGALEQRLGCAPRRLVAALVLCGVVGSSSTYYAGFTVVLLLTAGPLVALARRDVARLLRAGIFAGAIVLTAALNLLPTFLFWLSHGVHSLASRSPAETEQFGLRAAQLLLPTFPHRLRLLSELGQRVQRETFVVSEVGGYLGVIGVVGFLAAVGSSLRRMAGGPPSAPPRADLRAALGTSIVTCLAVGVVGGAAYLAALAGVTPIRAWNRLSVFIACFSLLYVAVLLEPLLGRVGRVSGARTVGAALAAVAVLAVGILDEVPLHPAPASGPVAAAFRQDGRFVREIEGLLPRGAAVYQLPAVPFPEAGRTVAMEDYAHLRGYLHSRSLRWSYGAMKDREGRWLQRVEHLPLATRLVAVAAIGFDGLWVDRSGYQDQGRAIGDELARLVGAPVTESLDGTLAFYDLRPFARRARQRLGDASMAGIRTAVLRPVELRTIRGVAEPAGAEGAGDRWVGPRSALVVHNPTSRRRRLRLRADVMEAGLGTSEVRVSWPGGSSRLVVSAGPTALDVAVEVPPGDSTIQLVVRGATLRFPDGSVGALRVSDLELSDEALLAVSPDTIG